MPQGAHRDDDECDMQKEHILKNHTIKMNTHEVCPLLSKSIARSPECISESSVITACCSG